MQNLCADCGFDQYMYKLINCCVRVTARGYDGEPSHGDEEKWGLAINAYKRVLITSLQFLNNFSAKNERRKLLLWTMLFDGPDPLWQREDEEWIDAMTEKAEDSPDHEGEGSESDSAAKTDAHPKPTTYLVGPNSEKRVDWRAGPMPVASVNAGGTAYVMASKNFTAEGYSAFIEEQKIRMRTEAGPELGPDQLGRELGRRWMALTSDQRIDWRDKAAQISQDKEADKQASQSSSNQHADPKPEVERPSSPIFENSFELLGPLPLSDTVTRATVTSETFRIEFSAEDARALLEDGKQDLIRRISAYAFPEKTATEDLKSPEDIQTPDILKEVPDAENSVPNVRDEVTEIVNEESRLDEFSESESEEESDEEDDYHGSTEDGRGLLTDVPLILGPSEIEILPNMIMSGLIPQAPPNVTPKDLSQMLDIYGTRCHLLLAHENGRNLLRELLIFVAAWDLREEELYFKFMVRIMEALLLNELLPFAYNSFRDHSKSRSKDIISPAQAVMMKLLTSVFRSHAENGKAQLMTTGALQEPSLVEVQLVKFLFTEFRQRIVPSTCALIFLQGKIHDDMAPPEDFPLNLWDMERMYEGVYQYLEFFAVLTEEAFWKDIMAKWEVASELVTMLKELEDAIPKLSDDGKKNLPEQFWKVAEALYPEKTAAALKPHQGQKSEQGKSVASPNTFKGTQIKPPEVPPLSIPGVGGASNASAPGGEGDVQAPFDEDSQEEPSDFEWRNLKKLTVLVLSSLIWKNKTVQDQVREFGGLEALVGCCRHDEHNPYIREHAIMCLRFAVEGNSDNAAKIREMADIFNAQIACVKGGQLPAADLTAVEVPREVLDTQGYETFMDGKGQVGLRRKESQATVPTAAQMLESGSAALQAAAAQAIQGAIAGTPGLKGANPKMTKLAAERAAELMQNALRDLPLADGFGQDTKVIIDRLNKVALENAELISAGSASAPAKKAQKRK